MVARGDLGIEIAAEKIPAIQRILIRKCVERKKTGNCCDSNATFNDN